jgi:hypothetical protein
VDYSQMPLCQSSHSLLLAATLEAAWISAVVALILGAYLDEREF